jgi:hypothetical protein
VVVLISCAFLLGTILANRGERPWKASILPAIFHGLRDLTDADYKRLADPAEMRREADNLVVRLEDWDDGLIWQTISGPNTRS